MDNFNQKKLYSKRDFRGNFSFAINYLQANGAKLLSCIAFILPIALLMAWLVPSQDYMQGVMQDISRGYPMADGIGFQLASLILLSFISSYLVLLIVLAYIREKEDNPNPVLSFTSLLSGSLAFILPIILASICYAVAVTFGLILCIIPGLFLAIVLGFFPFAQFFDGYGVIDSLKRSYELVMKNLWETVGYILIVEISIGIISFVITTPSFLLSMGIITNPIAAFTITTFTYLISIVFMVVRVVLYVVYYFSLKSQFESLNEYDAIDSIGNQDNRGSYQG